MSKPNGEDQLSVRRPAEYCGTFRADRHCKLLLRPSANVLDEELLSGLPDNSPNMFNQPSSP
jgi:hypothetical protein